MNCDEANNIDIVDFLASLGYQPAKQKGNNYWYISPLPGRQEKTPSFKVNRSKNVWYDFGLWEGGSLIDLGTRMYKCDVSDFLRQLSGTNKNRPLIVVDRSTTIEDEPKIKIVSVGPITSRPLYYYLHTRAIPPALAKQYLQEVNFEINEKRQYALGFKNRSGGYELRNSYFKGSSSPKDIRLVEHGSDRVVVFEGFFNFLSFLAHHQQATKGLPDAIILNTKGFFNSSRPIMEKYKHVDLYMDNDKAGRDATESVCGHEKSKGIYTDCSDLYASHKDYNKWWQHLNSAKKVITPTAKGRSI
jgi:hypothetical protein